MFERSPHFDRRRAEVILARVGVFSRLFALMTLAFIALDAALLPASQWQPLAAGRVATAAAFGGIGLWAGRPPASLWRAIAAMALLFAVPAAFALFAHDLLHQPDGRAASRFLAAAYSFMPFLIAAGVATFPLRPMEAMALVLLAFGVEFGFQLRHAHQDPLMSGEAFWLLFLVATIAAFAATSQAKLLAELVRQMIRDPLTACLRRESGQELLESQLALCRRHGAPLTVMFADLDHFKHVNDAFGHEAGDAVLAQAAASLKAVARESDTVLRWGGEEFVVVLPNTGSADAVRLVERLRERGVARMPDGTAITLSVGIAETLQDGLESVDALVELADRRMYQAKQGGRDRYVAPRGAALALLA